MFETISPSGWGLKLPEKRNARVEELLGYSPEELELRSKNCVYQFLDSLFDEEAGALRHYYRADVKTFGELDSGNFLMVINYLVMYDLYGDARMLERAESCFDWAYRNTCEIHPMFTWQGGVRDGQKPQELYVKYTGDAFLAANALYRRTGNEHYLFCIRQFHNFFKQARKAGFQYKYHTGTYQWSSKGYVWQSFGFPLVCYLELYELTQEKRYLEEAVLWGEQGLRQQAEDGCFYLLDGEFWNSDLTAPELRGLCFLSEVTGEQKYLDAAVRFGRWVAARQREDGSFPIGIDSDGEICAPNVGPGDMPNIALSMLRLHRDTGEQAFLDCAVRAVRYGLSLQAAPDGKYPEHLEDPHVKWGFWSWDPLFDHSLSGDQSVHHIRGILFLSAYLAQEG